MSRAHLAVLALSLAAACTDEEPEVPSIEATSHVADYYFGETYAPKVDLLFVIDDTSAMAPYQDRLAELPAVTEAALTNIVGGMPDMRIAVTTNGGALRTSPDLAEPYVAIERHRDGTRTPNFSGSLRDALAPLMDVGATTTGPNQLFHAAEIALDSGELLRDHAYLAIVTVSAADDASLAAPSYYASAFQSLELDPLNVVVGGIYPPATERLDAFHAAFPHRSTVVSLDGADWSQAFSQLGQLFRTTLGLPCYPKPLDIDPEAPGDQYDCSMSYVIDDVELRPLAMCDGEVSGPCWELVDEPNCDFDVDNDYYLMTMKLRGTEFAHPAVHGQCVVK